MKVSYESLEIWRLDYLRCNPSFYGVPRFDSLIFCGPGKAMFAKLICLFTCVVAQEWYPLALVQVLQQISRTKWRIDIDLSLHRFRMPPRKKAMFIPLRSIICRAYISFVARRLGKKLQHLILDILKVCTAKAYFLQRAVYLFVGLGIIMASCSLGLDVSD